IGEEAVATGAIKALDMKTDYVAASYRDHGHALACGMEPNAIMAELYGKATGCSKGKGGSMHMFDSDLHMLGGNGIVGGQIPVAAGAAFKIVYKKERGVVLCFFGDGAIHQGSFHESLNLAKIYNLPVIYICENNQYGMGTDFKRVSSVDDFSIMGASYGIEGKQLNGMDVLEVYSEVSNLADKLKKTPGPGFLEIKTYRYKGHSMSDPAKYRTKEELAEYKLRDPIELLKVKMIEAGILTEEDYQNINKKALKIAKDSAEFSENSPEPDADELFSDVYAVSVSQ
ncbi:MAG TPA: pyruvate dehydrogenase (acetyl-transferring) E1 component subunit alpha, partial [Spirochaeta sp.]|nr:pyruvate dehydrogenase (acetyl-transferring) E1 component subunit alpha [Spirochaeta sp.]